MHYDWIDHVMKYVAKDNNLQLGNDIKLLTVGETKDFYNYILAHQNQTLYGLLFCTTEYDLKKMKIIDGRWEICRFLASLTSTIMI